VPRPSTAIATFDVNWQDFSFLACKRCFPHVTLQATLLAEKGIAAGEAGVFFPLKKAIYRINVIHHGFVDHSSNEHICCFSL
jgi:hypothetical protein